MQSGVTYALGGQRREPDAHRDRGDQRHRQRPRQRPNRQAARQHPDGWRRQRHAMSSAAGDIVIENAGEGTDTVQASVTYTLRRQSREPDPDRHGGDQRHRQRLANVLTGNSGNNVLDGGVGADTMAGAPATTPMSSTTPATSWWRVAGEGTDTVQSSVTYTLAANVENLTLTGTPAINGTGNTLNNVLTGNAAANVLTGGAGQRHLRRCGRQAIGGASTNGRRGHRHGPVAVTYTLRRQPREPDADRQRRDQRHRQRPRQCAAPAILSGGAIRLTGGAGQRHADRRSATATRVRWRTAGEGTDTVQSASRTPWVANART